jgi:hypothetical protein
MRRNYRVPVRELMVLAGQRCLGLQDTYFTRQETGINCQDTGLPDCAIANMPLFESTVLDD